jgi:uncharacterized protein (DUF4415 family)
MRDIKSSNNKKRSIHTKSKVNKVTNNPTIHLTLLLDTILVTQARNILQAQATQAQFTQQTLSSLIRHSLELHQANQLKLLPYTPHPKKEISIRFPHSLYTYYRSIDQGQRTRFVNSVFHSYLQQL